MIGFSMKRTSLSIAIAFAFGCLVTATTISGCSKAADRTLTLFQFQSTKTHAGQFRIDTTALPAKAIETTSDSGGPGDPLKRITLNSDYEIEVVLRLASKELQNGLTDR